MNAVRFQSNPIIRPDMLDGADGDNINGPSLIRAPQWLPGRLGEYYLYFAHHGGQYIRLAVADDIRGPWQIHPGGSLRLDQAPCGHHIASPDVHVDDHRREVRMYYHGVVCDEGGVPVSQNTFVATSSDGLSFTSGHENLGLSYFRVFRWGDHWYTLQMPGQFLRSEDGLTHFETGPSILKDDRPGHRVRHSAVRVVGDDLWVLFSRVGDAPERILLTKVRLTNDWSQWTETAVEEVLQPETDYEGGNLSVEPSVSGLAPGHVRQLRDPAIYAEDGKLYLLYSIAGESGLAGAELRL